MEEFVARDLTGSRFDNVDLSDSAMRSVDLSGVDIRGARLHGVRIRGAELSDVEISGEILGVVVNGVDIGPLVEAELNRRDPDRAKLSPADPDGYREAWAIVERRWKETIERAQAMPEDRLHEQVDDEWSFVQTLRHLNFAMAAWIDRMILGDPAPYDPLDLPWDEAPAGIERDRDERPSLDEVLALRAVRIATVDGVLAGLTEQQLGSTVSRAAPGWPQVDDFPLAECLRIVLIEAWEHRNYAERDLAAIERRAT